MNRKHRLSGIAAMAVLLCGLSSTASAATQVIDRIVAVVNEDIILLSELNARMAPFVQRIQQQDAAVRAPSVPTVPNKGVHINKMV